MGYPRASNGSLKHGDTGSIIDELNSWDVQKDQMVGKSGVTRSIIDQLYSSHMQRDQMESEGGVTQSIIDELHSSDMVKLKLKFVLIQV